MKPFSECRVCQNIEGEGVGDCPYHGTPANPRPHRCIDWSDPRPCCLLAERARDLYSSVRRNTGALDRAAGAEVERRMGPAAREALRRVYNLG